MPWVLKAREAETGFLGEDQQSQFVIVQDSSAAREFPSKKDAQTFQSSVSATHAVAAWRNRPPELVVVRIGEKSFIVRWWAGLFGFLRCLSLFWLITRIERLRNSYVFVEGWVLGWGIAAVVALLALVILPNWARVVVVVFGGLRVTEIVIYHINVLLLDEWRSRQEPNGIPYAVRSYRRTVVLLLHNYIEILFWFSSFYFVFAEKFHTEPTGLCLNTIGGAFYHSVVTMATLGYGDIYPKTNESFAMFLTVSQTLIGVFLAVVVIARVITLVPRPLSMDEHEGQ